MSRGLVTVQMGQIFIGSQQKSLLAGSKGCSCFHSLVPVVTSLYHLRSQYCPDTWRATAGDESISPSLLLAVRFLVNIDPGIIIAIKWTSSYMHSILKAVEC